MVFIIVVIILETHLGPTLTVRSLIRHPNWRTVTEFPSRPDIGKVGENAPLNAKTDPNVMTYKNPQLPKELKKQKQKNKENKQSNPKNKRQQSMYVGRERQMDMKKEKNYIKASSTKHKRVSRLWLSQAR